MRETPRAKLAFNDYLVIGADRSLENLLKRYQDQPSSPTTRLSTLKEWSTAHGWQARLAAIAETERQAIVAEGIASKQNRIDALNDRWRRLRRVIDERAEDSAMDDVPGGKTGLLVHQVKQIGQGRTATIVDEYVLDTGLLKETREHEKQAAIELSQWAERQEITGANGGPVQVEDVRARILARLAILPKRGRTEEAPSEPE